MVERSNGVLWQQRMREELYTGSPEEVAQRLLGKVLVRQWPDGVVASGIIVEVEAYLAQHDPASHSYGGIRKRNMSMFKGAGTLYVYTIHSRHCLNIVTEPEGVGSAVLIRALEPHSGLARMWDRTQADRLRRSSRCAIQPLQEPGVQAKFTPASPRKVGTALTTGPGRLCRALDVDLGLDGISLLDFQAQSTLWVSQPPVEVKRSNWKVAVTSRVGISKAQEKPLRWFIDGNRYVSGRASEHSAGRAWGFMPAETQKLKWES